MFKKLRLRLVARTGVRDSGVNQNAHSAALEEKFDIFEELMQNVARHENIDISHFGWPARSLKRTWKQLPDSEAEIPGEVGVHFRDVQHLEELCG